MTQARTYPAGVTSWVDTEQDDVEAAQEFYGALFGWTFTRATPPGIPWQYVVAQLEGQDVAGIGGPAAPSGTTGDPSWNTYVAVADIEAAVADVVRAGGATISPPADAGEGGRAATCADPAGVQFRLWQAKRRLGAQAVNLPGAWNFSDLHATDPHRSQEFYEHVFGWVFVDMGFGTTIQVPGYADHLAATVDPGIHDRQAAAGAPPGFADVIGGVTEAGELGPHWHVTFSVADRDEAASSAESLGASVLGVSDTGWTREVLLRDPQGAAFSASQFVPPGR